MTLQAIWRDTVIAQSDDLVKVEGNYYFPESSLNQDYFTSSSTHTTCGWKGQASYYNVTVNGSENPDAAWYYPDPKSAAAEIKGRVAFWKGVTVREKPDV